MSAASGFLTSAASGVAGDSGKAAGGPSEAAQMAFCSRGAHRKATDERKEAQRYVITFTRAVSRYRIGG